MATEAACGESPASIDMNRSKILALRPILTVTCVAAALVHPLALLLGRHLWIADLLSHFQEPALVATILAVLVSLRRHRFVAAGLAFLAAFQIPPLLRYEGAPPVRADARSPERLRILVANVLHDNKGYDRFLELIRVERPDIVALVEFSTRWKAAIAASSAEFPYRVEYASVGGADGMALWSRKPLTKADPPEWLVEGRNCVIHATFEFAGSERHLWVVHPTSPIYRFGEAGNAEILAIAARVRDTGGSQIVVGDLNCTDGSLYFRDLLETTRLRDSRLGFGRQASWPSRFPYRIAIDHALVSSDLAVVDRRLGPNVGSDHFPVIVELASAATKDLAQSTSAENISR
jgi:endonuclease/exonuclease/phosphatase (EEP) superfamily protein YafD